MAKCYPQSLENIVKCEKITKSIQDITTTLDTKRKIYKREPTIESEWYLSM